MKMTEIMSNYFEAKTQTQTQQSTQEALPAQPRLQYYEMWANYERMMRILDQDDVVDLNIELTNVIGNAVKRKREQNK